MKNARQPDSEKTVGGWNRQVDVVMDGHTAAFRCQPFWPHGRGNLPLHSVDRVGGGSDEWGDSGESVARM